MHTPSSHQDVLFRVNLRFFGLKFVEGFFDSNYQLTNLTQSLKYCLKTF